MSQVVHLRNDVTVFTSALCQTNSVVIQAPKTVFVVDPCWLPSEVQAIREFVDSVKGSKRVLLIFTHSDYDHIIGAGAFPDAKHIASKAFPANSGRHVEIARRWDDQHYISREYSIENPNVSIKIQQDGRAMHYSGTVMTYYLAPGHTSDGLFIVWEPAGVFIAGDYFSDLEFPFIEDSITAYRRTLAKTDRILRSHQVNWMIPGHGAVADSIDEIIRRKSLAMEYLDDLEAAATGEIFPVEKYQARYQHWPGLEGIHQQQLNELSK